MVTVLNRDYRGKQSLLQTVSIRGNIPNYSYLVQGVRGPLRHLNADAANLEGKPGSCEALSEP